MPGSHHHLVGHGSSPKEALGHDVTGCTELYSPNNSVPGAGGLLGACGAARDYSAGGCSTAVWEAQASWAALLKKAGGYAFARDITCAKLCLQILFLAASFILPCPPMQKCSCILSLSDHLPVQGGCQTLPAVPSMSAGVCSMLIQGGRERWEAGAKLLSGLRGEQEQSSFQAVQHLLDACEPESFCSFLEFFWLGCVSWLVSVSVLNASACPLQPHDCP